MEISEKNESEVSRALRRIAFFQEHSREFGLKTPQELGPYLPEEDDENVLVFGRWLERGCGSFIVATAGVGKSTDCMQRAHAWAAGLPFAGLRPRKPLEIFIHQTEDSLSRLTQDREDSLAELKENHAGVDWNAADDKIHFVKLPGVVGVDFLSQLKRLLSLAKKHSALPDLIILNPFLAFIGGSITDGKYVTPFLRGGKIDGEKTEGLQAILEEFRVGALFYHHTPKPPTDKELEGWMKSQFPEYQGAGSSDITNWGRSFITMMRVKDHPGVVCLTAGKNGGELGWERVGGAFRRYMAYSNEIGISGKGRHAWRDLTSVEYAEIVGQPKESAEQRMASAVAGLVAAIKSAEIAPTTGINSLEALRPPSGFARADWRAAIKKVVATRQPTTSKSGKSSPRQTTGTSATSATRRRRLRPPTPPTTAGD